MIYQMRAEGRFLQRIKLGERAAGWPQSEARDWLRLALKPAVVSSMLRIEDRTSRYSRDSKKNCQRPIDRDKTILMQSADGRANLVTGDRLRLVYHDLRFLSEAIVGIWLNRNSKQWGGAQLARDWQDSH